MKRLKSASLSILRITTKTAQRVTGAVWDNREELAKAAKAAASVGVNAGKKVTSGAGEAGRYVYNHRGAIATGAAVTGSAAFAVGKGAAQLTYDTGSLALYRDTRIAELRKQLHEQGLRYNALVSRKWHGTPMAETLAVGGSLLTDIISTGHTPDDVQRAFELAYPHAAQTMSFAEDASRLHGQELVGLINGVKGKLFEIKYVDYLNSGELPDGYTAHLAVSPIQPGWDIAVHGPDGHTAELLQLKAADSVSYVKDALIHHPDIHVVTTDEVYDKLVLHGAIGDVSNSVISNTGLNDHVANAAEHANINVHWAPPVIALALHAFSAYRLDTDINGKARYFGERFGKSWMCYLLGGAVATATQANWLGLVTGMSTRYLAAKGKARRELCQEMERQIARNELMLTRESFFVKC